MKRANVSAVNALAELEALNWKYEPISDDEIRVCCPAHGDSKPSATMNVKKNLWKCHAAGCGKSGDIVTFLAYAGKVDRRTALVLLSERYPALKAQKEIPSQTVEKFHGQIWDSGPLLQSLRERGITDIMIREARLGVHDGRITIPVFDRSGRCVNVRRYLPGAPGPEKMRNTTGYGDLQLYRVASVVKHKQVWICGGEMKALVVDHLLPDVGACSATGGEGAWSHAWSKLFKGKDVFVCMDIDAHGMAAARKVANFLEKHTNEVRIVRLPLDREQFPKGDVNDYIATGAGRDELENLMRVAPVFVRPEEAGSSGEVHSVQLEEAVADDHVGLQIKTRAVVSAMDQTPYYVPAQVAIECTRDQPGCHQCAVNAEDPDAETGFTALTIPGNCHAILRMCNASLKDQREAVCDACGIPKCKVMDYHVRSHHVVHELRLAPQLEITGERTSNDFAVPAVVVDQEAELNVPYEFRGSVWPHPRTQRAQLVLSTATKVEDTLNDFTPSPAELEELTVFRPAEWTVDSLAAKLDHIYDDIEANVTWIFGRRDCHLALDLTWHSVLFFDLEGRRVNGWMNSLLIGDSSQGKTEMTVQLIRHYGLGERVDCKNATVAGLLGGLEQLGTRWFVSWGVIPLHDRRLVVLEEVKGASQEVLAKLTDMRSSGIAEIPKIERRKTFARTRMVFLSNPRLPRPMDSYNFGIQAVQELMGSLEDVRRFDLAVILAKADVDYDGSRPQVEHVYTAELSRRLILFAWTCGDVHIEEEAVEELKARANRLCGIFTEAMPLIDRGTTKQKLARMAAALAARTYSVEEGQLVVRACHVAYVAAFVEKQYSKPTYGYRDFSEATRLADRIEDPELVGKHLRSMQHPRDLVQALLHRDLISIFDLQDLCEVDRDGAQRLLSVLVRKRALVRKKRMDYIKTPGFIVLLKKLLTGPLSTQAMKGEKF